MAAILSGVLRKEIQYVPVSDESAKAGLMANGEPESYADMIIDLYRYYRTGAVAKVTPVVKEITGREPILFEQFVRDYESALR